MPAKEFLLIFEEAFSLLLIERILVRGFGEKKLYLLGGGDIIWLGFIDPINSFFYSSVLLALEKISTSFFSSSTMLMAKIDLPRLEP